MPIILKSNKQRGLGRNVKKPTAHAFIHPGTADGIARAPVVKADDAEAVTTTVVLTGLGQRGDSPTMAGGETESVDHADH